MLLFFMYITHFSKHLYVTYLRAQRNRSQKNAPGEFRENFTDYQSIYPDDLQSDLHGILRIRDAVE